MTKTKKEKPKDEKQIRIRIYRIQDYDLYLLYFDPAFNLQEAFRIAISAYANGKEPPLIDVSNIRPLVLGNPACITMSFKIKGMREIQLLSDASRTWRNMNNFCKSILRRSIVGIDAVYGLEGFADPMTKRADTVIKKKRKRKPKEKKKDGEEAKDKKKAEKKTEGAVAAEEKKEESIPPAETAPAAGTINPFDLIAQLSEE